MAGNGAGAAATALLLTLAPAVLAGSPLAAQQLPEDESGSPAAAALTVTASEVEAHVDFLASDELGGRDTPSRGLEVAARYVATRFGSLGLEPLSTDSAGGFIRRFEYEEPRVERAGVEYRVDDTGRGGGGSGWTHGRDFLFVPSVPEVATGGEVLYAGPARAAADGLPAAAEGRVVMATLPPQGGGLSLTVARRAVEAGAAALVLVLAPELGAEEVARAAESAAVPEELEVPVFGLRHDRASEIVRAAGEDPAMLDRSGDGASRLEPRVLPGVTVELTASVRARTHHPPNLAAVLPGSDPELRGRYVVFSAHLDHVGTGPPDSTGDSIYNGADDNAAGVAALLELAESFAALEDPPERSVVFFASSGEEKGLLGTRAFVQNGPVSTDSVAAVLNMDLLGRNHPDTLVAVGRPYSTLGDRAVRVAKERPELGLRVVGTPDPSERAFFRSDHLPFARSGVPSLLFTTWLHEDYHQPSDEAGKIDAGKTARIARLLFWTGLRVAGATEPPRWTEEGREVLESLRAAPAPGSSGR